MVVSRSGTNSELGHANYVQICVGLPCYGPRNTLKHFIYFQSPAHSFDLRIVVVTRSSEMKIAFHRPVGGITKLVDIPVPAIGQAD